MNGNFILPKEIDSDDLRKILEELPITANPEFTREGEDLLKRLGEEEIKKHHPYFEVTLEDEERNIYRLRPIKDTVCVCVSNYVPTGNEIQIEAWSSLLNVKFKGLEFDLHFDQRYL